ncbi:MAG TPA: hypothetical protein VLM41_00125 [Steroidobacteraceae bacterium]|nr:hypothetical protein [Steroidobacteraceae bacterium]
MRGSETRPWYRQLWPWLLMLPPVLAVVGGGITLYLAVTRPDVLIRKDCVKDGVTMRCGDDGSHGDDAAARGADQPSP